MRTRIALGIGVGLVGLLLFVGADPAAPPEATTAAVDDLGRTPRQAQERASQAHPGARGPKPAGQAARHLRSGADCLDVTRRNLLPVLDSPGREQTIVNGVAQACGLAFIQYSGMSREARALVEQAVQRIDMNDLAGVDSEEELHAVLDDIIMEYDREADHLESR